MYHLIKKTRYFSLVKLVRVGLGSDVFTQSGDFLVLI